LKGFHHSRDFRFCVFGVSQLAKDVFKRFFTGTRFKLFERRVRDEAAVVDHDNAMTDFLDDVQNMGTVQDRFSAFGQFRQQVFD
jgi:hypothetical protein